MPNLYQVGQVVAIAANVAFGLTEIIGKIQEIRELFDCAEGLSDKSEFLLSRLDSLRIPLGALKEKEETELSPLSVPVNQLNQLISECGDFIDKLSKMKPIRKILGCGKIDEEFGELNTQLDTLVDQLNLHLQTQALSASEVMLADIKGLKELVKTLVDQKSASSSEPKLEDLQAILTKAERGHMAAIKRLAAAVEAGRQEAREQHQELLDRLDRMQPTPGAPVSPAANSHALSVFTTAMQGLRTTYLAHRTSPIDQQVLDAHLGLKIESNTLRPLYLAMAGWVAGADQLSSEALLARAGHVQEMEAIIMLCVRRDTLVKTIKQTIDRIVNLVGSSCVTRPKLIADAMNPKNVLDDSVMEALEALNGVCESRLEFVIRILSQEEKRLAGSTDEWVWCADDLYTWSFGISGESTEDGCIPGTFDKIDSEKVSFKKDAAWTGYNYNTFRFGGEDRLLVGITVDSKRRDGWGGGSWRIPKAALGHQAAEVEVASAACRECHWEVTWHYVEVVALCV